MNAMHTGTVAAQEMLELVRYAVMAPSGHNTQPWQFVLSDDRIDIRPDLTRRLPAVDPDDHALYISLGAALENLLVAAHEQGYDSSVSSPLPTNAKPSSDS